MANNQTKPNQTQSRAIARAGGLGRSRIEAAAGGFVDYGEQPPLTERRAKEFAWVRQHLPQEHEGMAVSALISIQTFGDRPTKESVLARLRAQGRTAEQMREKAWIE